MPSLRMLILAGGVSEEHEVSLVSARSVALALQDNPDIAASVLVITRQGRWLSPADSRRALESGRANEGGVPMLEGARALHAVDIVFPLIHGTTGEDGRLQGVLEFLNTCYIGSGVLASALCMDKPMTKEVLRANAIAQVPYRTLLREETLENLATAAKEIIDALGLPLFVKPAAAGSSIGVTKVKTAADLPRALEHAFAHDRRVICEAGLEKPRELEVAILGNEAPEASVVGEITFNAEFYDYETKYTDGRAQLTLPAKISDAVGDELKKTAITAYKLLDCAGFARVDFFYETASGKLYLNEVNTLPGFTPLSMYPKLWEKAGLTYPQLIARLIVLGQQRHTAGPTV